MPNTSAPRCLYMPDGSFRPFDAQSLTTELATRQRAGDLFSFAANALGVLPDPDPILRARGDDAQILADLAADEQVATAMLSRKYRVLNQQGYAFSPGMADKSEPDEAARLLCHRLIRDMERWVFTDMLSGILDAPFYGYTPLELMWRPEGNWWHLVDVIPRPPEWFGFDDNNRPIWKGASGLLPEELPNGKFIFARHFPTYKNPYGLRLLSRCLWPVAFKKGGIQFYVTFVEKYGMPWAVGTAPAKATRQEKIAMANDLARMVQDAAAVIPAGATVQLHTASGQVGDLHERFLKRWDAAVSKVLMGQTLTAELDGKGSYAAAETHKDVADEMAEADRRLVESALNEIAWLYCQINNPAALSPVFSYEEKQNLKERADLDTTLANGLGVRFTPSYIEKTYKLDPTEFTVVEPGTKGGGEPRDFAALADRPANTADKAQETLDAALEKALPGALKGNAQFCCQLEKALSRAESFEDAQLLLADALAGEMGPDALETVLANFMVGAARFGHAAAKAEGGK